MHNAEYVYNVSYTVTPVNKSNSDSRTSTSSLLKLAGISPKSNTFTNNYILYQKIFFTEKMAQSLAKDQVVLKTVS